MTGSVSRIQRFCLSDGPGIRTTVFLKGCPLRCLWCHNPETLSIAPQLLYFDERCSLCGACAAVCPTGAHEISAGAHRLNRAICTGCGDCVAVCPCDALELRGQNMDAADALAQVLRDKPFYQRTGGGLTISGGEPLMQPDFTLALLQMAKAEGLHTCVDTSGFGSDAQALLPFVDLFLWDIKETDPAAHRRCTGVVCEPILRDLRAADAAGASLQLRCPIIPGINDRQAHAKAIGELADSLRNVQGIDLIAYHDMGADKARALGLEQQRFAKLSRGQMDAFIDEVRAGTKAAVRWHI